MIIALAGLVAVTPLSAAPCRDAKGHFIKCGKSAMTKPAAKAAPAKAKAKAKMCRDAKGHFRKC
ncbi:MAG: hypothetical protein KGL21_04025 [Alphaproteobacteria bacterium]|nr:hypothetical protein [Alphaproteobacteria bacterium]